MLADDSSTNHSYIYAYILPTPLQLQWLAILCTPYVSESCSRWGFSYLTMMHTWSTNLNCPINLHWFILEKWKKTNEFIQLQYTSMNWLDECYICIKILAYKLIDRTHIYIVQHVMATMCWSEHSLLVICVIAIAILYAEMFLPFFRPIWMSVSTIVLSSQ